MFAEYPVVAPNGGSRCPVAVQCVEQYILGALHRLRHQRHGRWVAGSEAEVRFQEGSVAG